MDVLARRSLRLNLVLDYLTRPQRNVSVRFDLLSPVEGRVELQFRKAAYSPTTTSPVYGDEWTTLASKEIGSGWNNVRDPDTLEQNESCRVSVLLQESGRVLGSFGLRV